MPLPPDPGVLPGELDEVLRFLDEEPVQGERRTPAPAPALPSTDRASVPIAPRAPSRLAAPAPPQVPEDPGVPASARASSVDDPPRSLPELPPAFRDLFAPALVWTDLLSAEDADPRALLGPSALAGGAFVLESLEVWIQVLCSHAGVPRTRHWLNPLIEIVRSGVADLAVEALETFVQHADADAEHIALLRDLASQAPALTRAHSSQVQQLQYLLHLVDTGSPEVRRLKRQVERLQGGAFVTATHRWISAAFPVLSQLYDALVAVPGVRVVGSSQPWPVHAPGAVPPVFLAVATPHTHAQAQLAARRRGLASDEHGPGRLLLGAADREEPRSTVLAVVLACGARAFDLEGQLDPVLALLPTLASEEYVSLPGPSDLAAALAPLQSLAAADRAGVLVLVPPFAAHDLPPSDDPLVFASLRAEFPDLLTHALRLLSVQSLAPSPQQDRA